MNLKKRLDLLERARERGRPSAYCDCAFDWSTFVGIMSGEIALESKCARCGRPYADPTAADVDKLVDRLTGAGAWGDDEPETTN